MSSWSHYAWLKGLSMTSRGLTGTRLVELIVEPAGTRRRRCDSPRGAESGAVSLSEQP